MALLASTASGVLSLNIPVTSARTEAYGPAAPAAIGTLSHYVSTEHPNTGNFIKGFQWDARVWYSEEQENIDQVVPVLWDPTISGITSTRFQSGIGSNRDLEYQRSVFIPSSGLASAGMYRVWAPEIRHGYYYDYATEGYLYSDDSEVVYPTYSGVVPGMALTSAADGFNQVELLSVPKVGVPVTAQRYRWNSAQGKYEVDLDIQKKVNFTGLRDADNVRQNTWSTQKNTVLWDLVDPEEPEFIVVDSGIYPTIPTALFNKQFVDQYPSTSALEELGTMTGGSAEQFHLSYAPIDNSMPVDVYAYLVASGTQTKYEAIPFSQTIATGVNQAKIDYDMGIVEFGDPTTSGVVVPAAGYTVAARYWRTVRVEYEPEESTDLVLATEANTNPIYRTSGRGFVYLSTTADDPASITLSAEAPSLQLNVFGPVYVGNAYVPVVATVKDALGRPLEGQTVQIFTTSEPVIGSFGAFGDTATTITDHLGEGRTYYTPPRSVADLGEYITASGYRIDDSPTYTGVNRTTILSSEDLLLEGNLDDIFLYEVHTDDPSQGYKRNELADSSEVQLNEYYRDYFDSEDIQGPTGLTSGVLSTVLDNLTSRDWEYNYRETWGMLQPTLFNASTSNGRKVLVTTYDSDIYNPHTFNQGAVAPFQPIDVLSTDAGYDVVFDTTQYNLTYPSGTAGIAPSGTLHSYFLVAPTAVTMQASVYNQRLNQSILSNTIQIKLDIPPYLSGMWTVDSINQTHIDEINSVLATGIASGARVALGYRLRSSNVTLAGALNGVTFLDVNPEYNAPIWTAVEPEVPGSGVLASGTYAQHSFTIT